jgi:hypothetical protein
MAIESDVKAIAREPERTGLIETLTQTLIFAYQICNGVNKIYQKLILKEIVSQWKKT